MLFRALVLSVVVTALAAAPASAAPTLEPLKPCYVVATPTQREFVAVRGHLFTPAKPVSIFVDDILAPEQPIAEYTGDLSGSIQAPFVEEGQRVFSLRLAETEKSENTVTATAKVTRLAVRQTPERASTSDRVRFRGRGFTDARPVYAHYVFAGKSRRTVRIGMPEGDCGTFSVRRKQFPFKGTPRAGVWTIWFDQEAHYNPKAAVRVPLTIRVRSQIKPRRAQAR